MEQHLEIETKYDLAPEDQVPHLVDVEGVDEVRRLPPVTLTATYYDTDDHRLLRREVTLRRREGGPDEGWHLKVTVADGARLELRRPLGRGPHPPSALTDPLVGLLGPDGALHPVASLVTDRTVLHLLGGQVLLAEVADDRVTARRSEPGDEGSDSSWREVEVELVDGDPAVLRRVDKVLRGAGLRPSRSTSKVGRLLAESAQPAASPPGRKADISHVARARLQQMLDDLLSNDPLLRLGRPGAATRQAATLRQVLTWLALLRHQPDGPDTRPLERELVWVLGAVRQAALVEEAAETIDAILRDEPRALVLGPVRRRADREVAATSRAATASLLDAMATARYARAVTAVEHLAAGAGTERTGPRAAKALPALCSQAAERLERRLARLVKAATAGEAAERAEAATRTAAAVHATDAAATSVSARSGVPSAIVQDCAALLWRLDVHRTAQDLVREMAVQAHLAGENGFTFGRVHGLLDKSAAAHLKRLGRRRKQLRAHRRRR